MEDTRDIAIRSAASAASAHHRLDGINGQIARLGDSHEKMREDFRERNEKLVEDFSVTTISLVRDVASVKTTMKIAAWAIGAIVSIASSVAVYEVTHIRGVTKAPPTLTITAVPRR